MSTGGFTTYCVAYDIDMLIRLSDDELLQAVRGGTAFELRSRLCVMRAQGIKGLIPKDCDQQTREGLCGGHQTFRKEYREPT